MTRLLIISILCSIFLASGVSAQDQRSQSIEEARAEFVELRSAVEASDGSDIAALETRLRTMRDASRGRLAAIERELNTVDARLAALGAPPGESDPPESEDLAAERATISSERARLNGQLTLVNANIEEANALLASLSAGRIETLYEKLTTRGASPLMPSVWRPAFASASQTSGKIGVYFDKWAQSRTGEGGLWQSLLFLSLALLAAVVIFGPVNRWIMRTFSEAIAKHEPTPARRVLVAGLKMLARAVPGLIGGFIVMETLRAQGILTDEGEGPARALWFGLVIYLLVSGFLSGLFAPANPKWRIAPVDADRARTISLLINAIVLVFGAKILATSILSVAGAADELSRLIIALVAVIVSVLSFLLCRTRLWRGAASLGLSEQPEAASTPQKSDDPRPQNWRIVRRIGRALAIITVIAALTGYVDLADFAASRVYYLSIIAAFAWFVRAILVELAEFLWRRREAEGDATEEETQQSLSNLRFWNGLVANTLLAIAVAPAILILAGVPPATVGDGLRQALFGFSIGGVRIPSLSNIFFAILVFIAVMLLTRVAQRSFRAGPFAHSSVDPGVQNSLITLIGYAGLLIALFAAISTIGFDLSNLALIAGALSVGIGFGLQSIVNNFVSGLILLFERPIKVGDWIVTTSGEGTVKRISVRSTEIETFDRSSIIVPNSELISSTVTNWTHRNKTGRVIVRIGVAYGSDVEKVKDILLRCANDHPLIVRYPEPYVTWQEFGDSSLDFDLRAFLADISSGLSVRTDLRFAINKAFAEEGIEIPFPQRDVHVKSWPENGAPKE